MLLIPYFLSTFVLSASTVSCSGNSQILCSSIAVTNKTIDVGQSTQITINGISSSTNLMSGNWLFSGTNITSYRTSTFNLNASYLGNWEKQNTYPLNWNITNGQSCNIISNTIYCIGGYNYNLNTVVGNVLYSEITSSGLSQWNSSGYSNYPTAVLYPACTSYNDFMYCVGGNEKDSQINGPYSINELYYSNVSATSKSWSSGPHYPEDIYGSYCGAYASVIYCVGGVNETSNIITSGNQNYTNYYYHNTNYSYYSKLNPSGVPESWNSTTNFPANILLSSIPSCIIYSSNIYCFAQIYKNYIPKNIAYYASLSSNGIGTWKPTTPYPENISKESCTALNNTIYCIGGLSEASQQVSASFSVPITSNGIGNWSIGSQLVVYNSTVGLTTLALNTPCNFYSNTLYCVDGSIDDYSIPLNYVYTANIIKPNLTMLIYAYSSNQLNITFGRGVTAFIPRTSNVFSNQNFGNISLSATINNTINSILINGIPTITITNKPTASIIPTNTILDYGQRETYAIAEKGGVGPFYITLYNYSSYIGKSLIYGTNTINQGQTAYFSFTPDMLNNNNNYFSSNLIDKGSEDYAFNTSVNEIILNNDPNVTLIPITQNVISGENGTYSVSVSNGEGPFTAELYNTNSNSKVGSNVIIYSSMAPQNTVTVGTDPYSVAINRLGTIAYVSNNQSNSVSVINLATNTVTNTITVGSNPVSLRLNPSGSFLYVANYGSNNVDVINTTTNTVSNTINTGQGPDYIAFNPSGTFAYVSNSKSNNISVISLSSNTVSLSIPVGSIPKSIAFNPSGTFAYVANSGSNTISIITTATNSVASSINVGINPTSVAINPSGTLAYVTNYGSNNLSIISTATNTIIKSISLASSIYQPTGPFYVTFNPTGTFAYIAEYLNSTISEINPSTNTVVSIFSAYSYPTSLAFNPSGSFLYITSSFYNELISKNTGTNIISFPISNTGTLTYNAIITDLGTTMPFTVSSAYNSIYSSAGSAATVSITPSNQTLDSGQYETLTATINGGSGSFNVEFYNISGSKQIGSSILISSGNSNSITFKSGNTGSYTFNAIASQSGNTISSFPTTITVNPSLSSLSISPSTEILDSGQQVTLTSSISGGSTPYHYTWYSGTSSTCSSDASIVGTSSSYSASPTSSTYYCLKVLDSASTQESLVSSTSYFLVNPTPAISITPSNSILDSGQYENYSFSISGGTGPFTGELINKTSDKQILSNITISEPGHLGSLLYQIFNTGSYNYNAIFTDTGTTTHYVFSSSSNSIFVNSQLLFTSFSLNANAVNINQPITISSTISGGSPDYNYTFYVYNMSNALITKRTYISSSTTNSFIFTTGTAAQYYANVIVSDSASTKEHVNATKQSFVVLENGALSVKNPTSTYSSLDQGQSTTILSSASGGIGPFSYQWYEKIPGSGSYVAISNANSVSYLFSTSSSTTPPGTYSFKLQVTDTGQTTNNVANSTSINIPLASTLQITSSEISSNAISTSGVLTISSSISGGIPPYTYNYSVYNSISNTLYSSSKVLSSSTSNSFSFSGPAGSYYAKIKVTDSASVTTSQSSSNYNFIIYIPFSVTSISGNTIIDNLQSTTLSATKIGGIGPFSYQWYQKITGSTSFYSIPGATSNTYTFNSFFTDSLNGYPQTYYFKLQAADNGESSDNILNSTPAELTINPQFIQPIISLNGNNINNGNVIDVYATLGGGTGPYEYKYGIYNSVTNAIIASETYISSSASNTFGYLTSQAGSFYANFTAIDSANLPESKNSTKAFFTVNNVSSIITTPSVGGGGGSGGGASSGGSAGAGGGLPHPTVTPTSYGYIISNFGVHASFTFDFCNKQIYSMLNFISPDAAGISLNNVPYTLSLSAAPTNLTDLAGCSMQLYNVSYIPLQQTVKIKFFGKNNLTNSVTSNSSSTSGSRNTTQNSTISNSVLPQNLSFIISKPYSSNIILSTKVLNTTLNISKSQPTTIYVERNGISISLTSTQETQASIKFSIPSSISYAKPKNYSTIISIFNFSIKSNSSSTLSQRINVSYSCNIPSNTIKPFILRNTSWYLITNFTTNSQKCSISFNTSFDPTVGVFSSYSNKIKATNTSNTSIITNTSFTTTTTHETTQQVTTESASISQNNTAKATQSENYSIIIYILVIIFVIIILYLLFKIKKIKIKKKPENNPINGNDAVNQKLPVVENNEQTQSSEQPTNIQ
jgi:YVTN family beta-propeller protein